MPFDPRVHVGVAVALVNPDQELLVVKRKGAHGADTWALPGGWVDYEETPEDTAAREMEEELDIRIPTSTFVLWDVISTTFEEPVDTSVTVLYGTKHWSHAWVPALMEPEKISDIDWVNAEQLITHAHAEELFTPLATLVDRRNNQLLHALGFRWPE